MKWALPAVGVGTISISKPSGASRAFSSSAICASLPGGLDVLAWISSCSSATTSPSGPSSCAFDAPGRSTAPTRNVTSTPASLLERMSPASQRGRRRRAPTRPRWGRNGAHHLSGLLKRCRTASRREPQMPCQPGRSDADRAPHGALAAACPDRDRLRRRPPGARGLDDRARGARRRCSRSRCRSGCSCPCSRRRVGGAHLEARARLARHRLRRPHAVGLAAAPARRAPARARRDAARRRRGGLSVQALTSLSSLLEARDSFTYGHSQRVTRHAERIAGRWGSRRPRSPRCAPPPRSTTSASCTRRGRSSTSRAA